MEQLFDALKIGSKLQTRETKFAEWLTVTVTAIDENSATMQNDDIGELTIDREEIDEGEFFRSAN